ncbi:MAG: recombinase family protein [Patescibacteria group bacterium]
MYDYADPIDYQSLRFVLYARKSTTDETRQVKSIEDQITECRELAKRLKLHVVGKPLTEEKSAKLPNQRPVFRQMITDLRNGKYDGILAWNPDRLARNMLEGGEIIDLIDQGIIRNLKFVTHHFTHDANGKMLLGMAFVLSKQYSDKLSQDVTRGIRSNFARGRTASFKHGYTKDDHGLFVPDSDGFNDIQRAWQMRVDGHSIVEIVDYLNETGYQRVTKTKKRAITLSKQQLSNLFNDSFYYGMLVQAGKSVDLRDIYDFQPMIDESTFNQVQAMTQGRSKKTYKNKRKVFYPLRGMVMCGDCGNVMTPYSPSNRKVMYYRCTNLECKSEKKNVRAKEVVVNFIYPLLQGGFGFTEPNKTTSNIAKK